MPNLSVAQKMQKKGIFFFEKDMKGGAVEMPCVSGPVRPRGPRLISSWLQSGPVLLLWLSDVDRRRQTEGPRPLSIPSFSTAVSLSHHPPLFAQFDWQLVEVQGAGNTGLLRVYWRRSGDDKR